MTDETLVLMMDTRTMKTCEQVFGLLQYFSGQVVYHKRPSRVSGEKDTCLHSQIRVGSQELTVATIRSGGQSKEEQDYNAEWHSFFKPVLKNIYDLVPNADFYYLCRSPSLSEGWGRGGHGRRGHEHRAVHCWHRRDQIRRHNSSQRDRKVKAKNDVSYVMLNGITSNGFLECELEEGEPVFRFHKASASELARKTKRNDTRRRKQTRGRERKKRRTRRPSLRSRYSLNTLTRRRKSRNSRNTKTRSTRRFVTVWFI